MKVENEKMENVRGEREADQMGLEEGVHL